MDAQKMKLYKLPEGDVVVGTNGKGEFEEIFFLPEITKNEGDNMKLNEAATEAEKKAQESRSEKYGIGIKDGGNVTKPSKYADVADADFADPVNYAYPIDETHIRPAVSYFNHEGQREAGGYTTEEWAIIGKRIAKAAGKAYTYKDGAIETPNTKNEGDDKQEIKNELYATIPNSYEENQRKIREALRKSNLFGAVENEWGLSIEATFADSVIVQKYNKEGSKYYKANWSINENGDVIFSEVKAVDLETVVKIKNEGQETNRDIKILNEDIQTSLMLEEVTDPITGITRYKGSTKLPNYAETKNRNKRFYSKKVITEAINELNSRIKTIGASPVYKGHIKEKDENGKIRNSYGLDHIVGGLNEINYDPVTNTVSLDDIEFADTFDGNEIKALAKLKKPIPFQFSQRAEGISHLVKNESNEILEMVDSLKIDGFDILLAGKASFEQPNMEFRTITEEAEMPDKKILTEEEIDQKLNGFKDGILNEIKNIASPEAKKTEETPPKPDPTVEAVADMKKQIDSMNEAIEANKKEKAVIELTKTSENILNETLKDEKYKSFTSDGKRHLVEISLKNIPELYGKVDMSKPDELKGKVVDILNEHVEEISRFTAQESLRKMGYGNPPGNGIQHVEVLNENYADGELTGKLTTLLNERFDNKIGIRSFYTDANHPVMQFMKQVEAKHIEDIHKNMQMGGLLNEATFVGTDVGPKIASVGISLIRAVFPRLSALQICQLGTMEKIQDVITVQAFSQAISANPYTNLLVLTPGEDTSLNTVKMTTTPYNIIATQKAVGGQITSLAQAIARGSGNIDPVSDTLEGIAKYFQTTINQLIWWSIICKAQAYLKTEVTNYTDLSLVSGSTYEFDSGHPGWIQFEWVKKTDANGNPVYAMPLALYGTTSADITYQPVLVREKGDDATVLTYGAANDYTINWADGTVTLTAAGLAKCVAGTCQAKYSYTTNLTYWSMVTPTGLTGEDALKNLGLEVGKAKSLVRNRDYEPTFIAMNFDNNDMVANSPIYTAAGNKAGNILDSRGDVSRWLGLDVAGDRTIPSEWLIVGTQGKAIYKIQSPMSIKRVPIAGKTNDELQVEQYDCEDCPEPAAFSLVGITDINT